MILVHRVLAKAFESRHALGPFSQKRMLTRPQDLASFTVRYRSNDKIRMIRTIPNFCDDIDHFTRTWEWGLAELTPARLRNKNELMGRTVKFRRIGAFHLKLYLLLIYLVEMG
jgi:hypothetical protein